MKKSKLPIKGVGEVSLSQDQHEYISGMIRERRSDHFFCVGPHLTIVRDTLEKVQLEDEGY